MADLAFALFETAAAWDEQGALARFRRALRRADQKVLDDLFAASGSSPASSQPGMAFLSELSVEAALLTALLAEQKELLLLWEGIPLPLPPSPKRGGSKKLPARTDDFPLCEAEESKKLPARTDDFPLCEAEESEEPAKMVLFPPSRTGKGAGG